MSAMALAGGLGLGGGTGEQDTAFGPAT